MDQPGTQKNKLEAALKQLSERLASCGHDIGSYTGHKSSTKGITLQTIRGSISLPKQLIGKLIWNPGAVTEEDLSKVAQRFTMRSAKRRVA